MSAGSVPPRRASTLPVNLQRDGRTVAAMVDIYCQDRHGTARGSRCAACDALLEYALQRLDRCPFGHDKTTCRACPIHCYRPAEREAMRLVMRHAGPAMIRRHPILAIRHLWLDRKGPPAWPPRARRQSPRPGHSADAA